MQIIAAAPCTAAMQAVSAANGCRQHPAATLRSCAASPTQRRTASGHQQRRLAAQRSGWRRVAVTAASDNLTYGADWATPKDAYVTVGLSHCFVKEEGKLGDQFVIEPITANSLECMAKGAKTSFTHVFSLRLGEALQRSKAVYPPEFADAAFCENYEARCDACARTWMRPHPMDNLLDIVPLGQVKTNFNFSTSDKRVLNADHIVNDDDNIKQDLSIDVYGRKGKDEEAEAAAPAMSDAAPAAAEAKEEEEADDMDALLTM